MNIRLDVDPLASHGIKYIISDASIDLGYLNIGILIFSDFKFIHALNVSLLLDFSLENLIEIKVLRLDEGGGSKHFVVVSDSTLVNNCDSESGRGI